jgi:hypothetical protein
MSFLEGEGEGEGRSCRKEEGSKCELISLAGAAAYLDQLIR